MVRTKQGGSVLAFIVGGILLLSLLGGGVYWISQQNKGVETPHPAPSTQQQQPEETHQPSRQPSESSTPNTENQPSATMPTQLPSDGQAAASELPETGPREVLISSGLLAILGGVAAAYIRSRRESASL